MISRRLIGTLNKPSNTRLLLHVDHPGSTTLTDSGPKHLTSSFAGTNSVSGENVKWGTGALKIVAANTSYWNIDNVFPSGISDQDFTIEFWVNVLTSGGTNAMMLNVGRSVQDYNGFALSVTQGFFGTTVSGRWNTSVVTPTLVGKGWTYVCLMRSGSTLQLQYNDTLYNGTVLGAFTDPSAGRVQIAGPSATNTTFNWTGYMDEIRVSKTAIYPIGVANPIPLGPFTS